MSNRALATLHSVVFASSFDSALLYREHAPRVARWLAQLGCPESEIEDATQEVFLLAHRERDNFRGEAQVTTWLYRISRNVARHQRRKLHLRATLGGSADEVAGHLQAPGPTAADAVDQRRSTLRLRRALARLPERDRAIILMFEIEGLSGQEIAQRTAAKQATVWVRLHRARAQLMAELARLPPALPATRPKTRASLRQHDGEGYRERRRSAVRVAAR